MSKEKIEEFKQRLDIKAGKIIEKSIKGKNLTDEEKEELYMNTQTFIESVLEHEDNKDQPEEVIEKAIFDKFETRVEKAIESILFQKEADEAIPNALKLRTYKEIYNTELKTVFGNVETGTIIQYDKNDTTNKISFSPMLAKFIINFSNGLPFFEGISQYNEATHPKMKSLLKTLGFKTLGQTSYKIIDNLISTNTLGYSIDKSMNNKGFPTTELNIVEVGEYNTNNNKKAAPTQIIKYTFKFDEAVAIRNFYNEVAKVTQDKQTMQEALEENTQKEIKGEKNGFN